MAWRARIGIVCPAEGTTDDEYWKLVPPGVGVYITRIPVPPEDFTVKIAKALSNTSSLEPAARLLTAIDPDAIAFACSSASFVHGLGGDRKIIERMEAVTRVACTTTSTAVVNALRFLGIKRLAVASPYAGEINDRLQEFLLESGFEIVSSANLELRRGIFMLPDEAAYRLAKDADVREAQAVFIPCTAFRTLRVLEPLEQDLGKPVISANQATMWESLCLSGVKPCGVGLGTLFRSEAMAA